MKTWHWIALGGIAVVAFVAVRRLSFRGGFVTTPPGSSAAPPAAGPTSEARSGRGHF
jgi:hypothetical protein